MEYREDEQDEKAVEAGGKGDAWICAGSADFLLDVYKRQILHYLSLHDNLRDSYIAERMSGLLMSGRQKFLLRSPT